jgi:hypothetical protein
MTEKSKEQIWADRVATQDSGHFRERLNAEKEDGKYKILAQLLRTRKIERSTALLELYC